MLCIDGESYGVVRMIENGIEGNGKIDCFGWSNCVIKVLIGWLYP